MNRKEFIENLTKELKEESYESVMSSLSYYEEMIDDLMESGLREEEAIARLGKMSDIVKSIKETEELVEIKPLRKNYSVMMSIGLLVSFPLWGSLLAAFLLLLLSAYIVIWCIPFTTVILAMSGVVCFFVGIFGSLIFLVSDIALGLTQLGVSAVFGSLGILGIWLTMKSYRCITKKSLQLTLYSKNIIVAALRKVGVVC